MIIRKPFYFLRHGQTEHNILELCAGGHTDSLLTDFGIQQARDIHDKIADLPIKHVVASPLQRAHQTARLATNHKYAIKLDPGIREWDLGDYEQATIPVFKAYTESLADDTPLPNGESRHQFTTRVLSSLNHWLEYHDDVLLVSHGLVYMAIIRAINQTGTMIGNAELAHFKPLEMGWQIDIL